MSAKAKSDWFWSDWLGDQAVRRLTPAERGVWIDLLALAAASNPIGYVCDDMGRPLTLVEIARVTNAGSLDEVAKLIAGILDKGAASRDRTGRLFNRRMVRDAELRAKKSRAGKIGAAHTNLINKQFRALSQHLPRQVTQQINAPPGSPLPKNPNLNLSSFSEAGETVDNSTENPSPTAPSERPQRAIREGRKPRPPLVVSDALLAFAQKKAGVFR